MSKMKVLGVDIGGTNIRMGLVDENYALTGFERKSTQALLAENTIDSLIGAIRDYLDRTPGAEDVAAISVGIPGQVSRDKSYVYSVPKVHGLQNTDLGTRISAGLGLPTYIGHDVDFLLTHDIRTMALDPKRNRTILGFYVGTGFGNVLYLNGSIHAGKHGVAGELGHIPLYGVEDVCTCGAAGCVETRCCGQYLADLVAREFPDCHIGEIFTRHGGDPRIVKFVKDCAIPIASEITILDPDYVLLGGGVITMPDFPLPLLESEIRLRSRHPLPAEDIRFVYASSSQSNGVVGGAMLTMEWMAEKQQ